METYAADYRKKFVGPFVLYTNVIARGNVEAPGILVRDKSGMQVRLPEGEQGSPALLDGDAETAWSSRGLQRAGMALDLILPEEWALSGIDVTLLIHPVDIGGGFRVPVPDGLRVLVSRDGTSFEEIQTFPSRKAIIDGALANARPIRAVPYRIFVPLGGAVARAIRLEILSPSPWPLEIAELDVYRTP